MGRIESKIERPGVNDSVAGSGTSGQVTYWSGNNTLGGFTLNSAQLVVGNGSNIPAAVTVSGDITISNAGVVAIGATKVTNAMLAGSIAYSKLTLTGAILNADLTGSIAYSKLSLTGAILNADLAGSIAQNKMVALTASRAVVTDGSGFDSASSVTATELGILSGRTALEEAKNWIHNGAMQIDQMAASVSFSSGTTHLGLDRFYYIGTAGTGTWTASQSGTAPTPTQTGFGVGYSLKLDNTSTATIGASDHGSIVQAIEDYDYAQFVNKTVTLSFWVNAVKNGIYCVSIQSASRGYSYVAEYTISAANTWEKKTISFLATPTVEECGFTGGSRGLYINFTLSCGSTFQTTANAWQTGTFYGTSNQVNGGDNTANNFFITLVQLNIGSAASPFSLSAKTTAAEMAVCQRFLEYSGAFDPSSSSSATDSARAYTLTTTKTRAAVRYMVPKRTSPTITIYSTSTSTSAKFRNVTAAADIAASSSNVGAFGFQADSTASVTVGDEIAFQWTADARLT